MGVHVAKALTLDTVTDVYVSHMSLLETLFKEKLKQFHATMADIL